MVYQNDQNFMNNNDQENLPFNYTSSKRKQVPIILDSLKLSIERPLAEQALKFNQQCNNYGINRFLNQSPNGKKPTYYLP